MLEITFETTYHTRWGERLVIVGSLPELGNGSPSEGLVMEYISDGRWSGTLKIKSLQAAVHYRYVVLDDQGRILNEEWGEPRRIPHVAKKSGRIFLKEGWRAKMHPANAYFTSAFLKVIFRPQTFPAKQDETGLSGCQLRFEIEMPRSFQRLQVCVLGNIDVLGNWDYSKPLLLNNEAYPRWQTSVPMPNRAFIQYKYGLYDPEKGRIVQLESGPNRFFSTYGTQDLDLLVLRDVYFQGEMPAWKGAGVALPVFALRTINSFGAGSFADLRPLIDWSLQVGMKMVQILPINDTSATHTWVDSYPYSSISVFALHPMYLDLEQLEGFKKAVDQKEYGRNKKLLNELEVIDYEKVMHLKINYARKIFEKQKDKFQHTQAFKRYFDHNAHWLKSYALFCVFRDEYGTPDFSKWKEHAEYSEDFTDRYGQPESKYYHKILFYYYIQFNLDQQLISVADYARQKGVVLKGDIAIGIYRYSADAWTAPHLFDMRSQAGAPPDPFSDLGQNWGFPTYRWEVMASNGYNWWQRRLQNLSRYFDAFRIDHILGFFRIWQIPYHQVQGILGYFNPAIPVTRGEMEKRGIPFDRERFCDPYITEESIFSLFGSESQEIKDRFLEKGENGRFHFKPEFSDQRKIYDFKNENPEIQLWQARLFQLHADILFLSDMQEENEVYHPRIDFHKTFSYQSLHPSIREALDDLYVDYFYRRQEDFWRDQGLTKLPAIKNATDMLICGEDLGMIPACVPEVMKELDLLTLEIQRMSKNPQTEFLQEKDIPYLSVCSTGTHDMSPIRAWWEESDPGYISRFFHRELHLHGIPPGECTSFVAEQIVAQHLHWPAMWAIFPLQDLLAINDELKRNDPMEERINIPANPNHYWRYRMHIPVETLLGADQFNHRLRSLLQDSGRLGE